MGPCANNNNNNNNTGTGGVQLDHASQPSLPQVVSAALTSLSPVLNVQNW